MTSAKRRTAKHKKAPQGAFLLGEFEQVTADVARFVRCGQSAIHRHRGADETGRPALRQGTQQGTAVRQRYATGFGGTHDFVKVESEHAHLAVVVQMVADRRIFPAIDVNASGTRREEMLFKPEELRIMWKLRRVLGTLDQQSGLELVLDKLKEIVLDKDENAFVTINAVHDIVGGRFKKKAIH